MPDTTTGGGPNVNAAEHSSSSSFSEPSQTVTQSAAPDTTIPPVSTSELIKGTEAGWPDSNAPNAKDQFNDNASKTSSKTTALPKKNHGISSRERRADQFWKARIPDVNAGKGIARMDELERLEDQRAQLELHGKLTPGNLDEQATHTNVEQEREKRIEYLKERLTQSHQAFENDFNRNRAKFVSDGQDRER